MAKIIRKEPRRHLVYYLRVVDPSDDTLIGRLVDITTVGMMTICANALEVGQTYCLRVLMPGQVESPRPLDVQAQVVWCHKDVNPDYYAAGMQFCNLSEADVSRIRDLIDALAFHD